MIKVVNFHFKLPDDAVIVNTTSRSTNWSRSLSPFFCGPVKLYQDYSSINVENAWQYSKVYEYYTDDNGNPDEKYFKWAQEGWSKVKADRYPMGKDVKPLYSYWDGNKLTYVEARHKIYIPLYSGAVQQTNAFIKLKELFSEMKKSETLYLQDFDAHNLEPDTFNYLDL